MGVVAWVSKAHKAPDSRPLPHPLGRMAPRSRPRARIGHIGRTMKPLTLSSVCLGLVVLLGLLAITPSSPGEAASGPCGLAQAALCDTFGNVFQGGRTGQLD